MEHAETTVRRFWALMASNDFHSVAEVLHPDFLLEWPQSGERIRGARNFAEMNSQYPAHGAWRFGIERLTAGQDTAASDVTVTDGHMQARAVTFFELKDGLIWRITEYWPEPFEAAAWRKQLVERG